MAYTIEWKLWEVPFEARHLKQWHGGKLKAFAEEIVARRHESSPIAGAEFGPLLGQELRDWVLRAGERYVPLPDHALDTYWRALRGLPGFYSPLALGVHWKRYLALGGAGEIGEGVALAVLESPPPFGLGQVALCRPLGISPDFILQAVADPQVRPLAEVKSTENEGADPNLVSAVLTLLDIYKAWQRHRPLAQTPGFAVSVQIDRSAFKVEILRLTFQGDDVVNSDPSDVFDLNEVATAWKAAWAGEPIEAARAIGRMFPGEKSGPESDHLAELQGLCVAIAMAEGEDLVGDPIVPVPRRKREGVETVRDRVTRSNIRLLEGADEHAAKALRDVADTRAKDLDMESAAERRGVFNRRADAALPRRRSPGVSAPPWRMNVLERADGLELRAYLPGRVHASPNLLREVLGALSGKKFTRPRDGFRAMSLWSDGVEWTIYADGRVQGWIPETQPGAPERDEMERDAARMMSLWNAASG